jgi:hypothetical protein
MAKDTQTAASVEQLATRLFADRTARNPSGRATEATVLACYRDAETFMQTMAKIQAGELSPVAPVGPQLADASCPNLKPTHPLNMISSRYGNLERVQQLHARLAADPKIDELKEGDLDWDKQAVITAREVFPHFAASTN